MGDHLIDGQFQSDKYPTTPRGKVPLSVKDPAAQPLLWKYAQGHRAIDPEFSDDLIEALRLAGYTGPAIDDLITEDWLKANGFKWHQFERQPGKHWLLWLGNVVGKHTSFEDIGLELAPNVPTDPQSWFCWLRGDCAGRYHRFIHVRYLETIGQLVKLIEAIAGMPFDPTNASYGSLRTPEQAAAIGREDERLDRVLHRTGYPWGEAEKDATRGRALPEHLNEHIKAFEKPGKA